MNSIRALVIFILGYLAFPAIGVNQAVKVNADESVAVGKYLLYPSYESPDQYYYLSSTPRIQRTDSTYNFLFAKVISSSDDSVSGVLHFTLTNRASKEEIHHLQQTLGKINRDLVKEYSLPELN